MIPLSNFNFFQFLFIFLHEFLIEFFVLFVFIFSQIVFDYFVYALNVDSVRLGGTP
jgi:hypothetical protein